MKMFELGSILIIIIVAACAIAGAVSVKYLGANNPVEEAAEAVIQEETGANVNLSPTNSSANPSQSPSQTQAS